MTSASNSSSRKDCKGSRGALGIHVPIEISGKSIGARGHARVFAKMRRVRAVVIGKRERPSAFRRNRDRFDVKAPEGTGREQVIVEKASLVKLLHRHHRLCGGVRHGGELAVAADPDIALAIGERGVEQRDIGPDCRGLPMTFQSFRCASTSEPSSPRSGMNGTPFSAAWNAACNAGQVASFTRTAPDMTAAVKRGAGPNSPRLTAEVSIVSTQPAPMSR